MHFLSFRHVKDLIEKEKLNIAKRIRQLRNTLSLTQSHLAKAVGVSKGTIVAIENGKNYSVDSLLGSIKFFAMSVHEFMKFDQAIPDELSLRKQIEEYHKAHNSEAYLRIPQIPNLNNLIELRLIKEGFLNVPRTVNEIMEYCHTAYDINLESSVLSQALINLTETGLLTREKGNGRKYLYQVTNKNVKDKN